MPNNLESIIHSIVLRTSTQMAREIAAAVRETVGQQINGLIGAAGAAPARRGPGRPRKIGVAAPQSTAQAAPTAGRAKREGVARGAKRGGKRRSITDAELDQVLNVLAKKPNLTSVQIQKEAGIDSKQAARVLNKLRESGRVKWKGARSAATYSVG